MNGIGWKTEPLATASGLLFRRKLFAHGAADVLSRFVTERLFVDDVYFGLGTHRGGVAIENHNAICSLHTYSGDVLGGLFVLVLTHIIVGAQAIRVVVPAALKFQRSALNYDHITRVGFRKLSH
jgi:hypothetical protein